MSREGFGESLFADLKTKEADFSLNKPEFTGAKVLVAGANFGCGSSREHAVWAIKGAGFRAVIAKSFADIFSSNSAKNGLLLVSLPEKIVDEILSACVSGDYSISIDIEKQTALLPNGDVHKFSYDEFRKHCLINGLDDIDYILSNSDKVSSYMKERESKKYFSTEKANR